MPAPERGALSSRWVLWTGAAAAASLALGAAFAVAGPGMLLAALALVALASAAVLARYLTPAHIICAGVALAMLSGNWGLLGMPFGLDRLVVLIGIAATLAAAARDPEIRLVARPVHLALMAATAWAACSALMVGSLSDIGAVYALMDRFGIVPFLAFFVAPYAFRTLAARLALIKTLVLMAVYLGATAVFEEIGPNALVFPRFILDPSVGIHPERARGPFLEAAANGLVMVMCVVACAMGLRYLHGRWRPLSAAGAFLCTVGVALTLTRSAWLALVLAGAAALGYTPHLRRYLLPAAAGAVVTVLAILLLVPGFADSAQNRAEDRSPVWDRQNLVIASENILREEPLSGIGWARFATDSPDYFRQADTIPQQGEGLVVHNVPLLYLTELGIPGFALWVLGAGVALFGPLLRRLGNPMTGWQAGHVAMVVAWLIVGMFAPLAQSLPNLLVFLWAGVTAACVPWMSPLSARPEAVPSAVPGAGTAPDAARALPVTSGTGGRPSGGPGAPAGEGAWR
jgi:O-antigen ligase